MPYQFNVTPYAQVPSMGGGPLRQSKILFNDVTLREGEQSGNVNLTIADKLALSRQLAEAGVDQIQGGFVGRFPTDFEFVRKVKAEDLGVPVETLVIGWEDNWKKEIEAGWGCNADVITVLVPGSDIRLDHLLHVSRAQVMKRAHEAMSFAATGPSKVAFGVVDSTRAELGFLLDLYRQAISEKSTRLYVFDTVGVANPRGMGYLVSQMKKNFPDVEVGVHCHNDFGLACANTLSAIEQGADLVDAAVNGIGDRSGNVALEEVAVCLAAFYGFETNIKLEKLYELSRSVVKATGVEPGPTKAFFGTGSFSHKFDVHVHGVTTYPPAYEGVDPAIIGQRRQVLLGKSSGLFALRYKLNELGLKVDEQRLPGLLQEMHKESEKRGRALAEATIHEIVAKC